MNMLINAPGDAVTESLHGLALSYPQLLRVHYQPDFIQRADTPVPGKVALVSGSGSGHEPLPTGFVGPGMLDAACPGPVFTSPTPDQLVAAAHAVDGKAGVIFVVKNYGGGVMNAEIAAELSDAEGITVGTILVNDDVTVSEASNRRGMGAAVLAMKIAGAAAEEGRPLEEVMTLGRQVVAQTRSMGVAMGWCAWPNARSAGRADSNTIELGVGIHGEPGRYQVARCSVDEIVAMMVEPILADLPFQSGDRILALVSGLGGTPLLELYLIFESLHRLLRKHSMIVQRQLVGNLITSLERPGCSITLLRLNDEFTALWDAPVNTPALHW
jgi:phosphoenolpyruvate---glycerone phosphotransferase subunit DhaK